MISEYEAKRFARRHYRKAPEKLAEHLNIHVRQAAMSGCDGWCLMHGDRAVIRINSQLLASRRRFTLAHELAHLILGVPTVVGESYEEMLRSSSEEERQVNELASALLLPAEVVKSAVPQPPVVAGTLKTLARQAKVSELANAIRVCNLASDIGLLNASVVFFDGDDVRWQWSSTLRMNDATAVSLLQQCRVAAPQVVRQRIRRGEVVVASIIENPAFGSATLFVQLLPEAIGMQLSGHERRKQLEGQLFAGNAKLQQRVAGLMGAHKPRISGMTEEKSIAHFWERNAEKLRGTTLDSRTGREYVRLRIAEWFH